MSFITIGAIQKESLRFEVHISCVNTAFSQIPCTYLPECFDKIRFLESVLNRCPRLRLAFKNIYGNVELSRIINSSCELFKATRCIRLVLYSCEKVHGTFTTYMITSTRHHLRASNAIFKTECYKSTSCFMLLNDRTRWCYSFSRDNQMEPFKQG